jgi:hypothetical protein
MRLSGKYEKFLQEMADLLAQGREVTVAGCNIQEAQKIMDRLRDKGIFVNVVTVYKSEPLRPRFGWFGGFLGWYESRTVQTGYSFKKRQSGGGTGPGGGPA